MRGKIGYISAALGLALLGLAGVLGQAAGANSAGLTPHAPAATGDWPMYGHDISRTNYNPDETILNAGNVNQLVSRWQVNVGSGSSYPSGDPSVANGRVFVGSSVSSGNNYFAFDAVSGAQAWSVSLSYTNACQHVGIGSTAAISGTTLVVGGGDTAYYGLDTATGAQLWRHAMNVGSSGFPWESPLLDYGRAYLGMASYCDNPSIRGEVRAANLSGGSTLNRAYFVNSGEQGGGIWNSPVMSPDHSVLIVATGEDYSCADCSLTRSIVSLNPLTLQIIQHYQEGPAGQDSDFGTTPVIFHDGAGRAMVGAGHKNGVFYAYVINNIQGGPVWSRSTGTSVGMMPAYDPTFGTGGTLFIYAGSQLYAVDPATGANRWGPVNADNAHGNMAIANGLIFLNNGISGLRILRESDGALLRVLSPANAGGAYSGVVVSNGFIYWLSGAYLNAWSLPTLPTPTATATPVPRQLVGHVTWEGRPAQPSALQQLPVTLTLQLGGATYNYPNQTTDASGFFTVSVTTLPTGVYTWWAKGPQYLATTGTVTLSGSPSTAQEMGVQPAGDVNNDNVVDVTDFSLLRATFGLACGNPGYDGRADFTGDCTVDITDFSLLRAHFGQTGPPQPTGPSAAFRDDR